jgi:hypothetical protein
LCNAQAEVARHFKKTGKKRTRKSMRCRSVSRSRVFCGTCLAEAGIADAISLQAFCSSSRKLLLYDVKDDESFLSLGPAEAWSGI